MANLVTVSRNDIYDNGEYFNVFEFKVPTNSNYLKY